VLLIVVFVIAPIVSARLCKDNIQKEAILSAFGVLFILWLFYVIIVLIFQRDVATPFLAVASIVVPIVTYFLVIQLAGTRSVHETDAPEQAQAKSSPKHSSNTLMDHARRSQERFFPTTTAFDSVAEAKGAPAQSPFETSATEKRRPSDRWMVSQSVLPAVKQAVKQVIKPAEIFIAKQSEKPLVPPAEQWGVSETLIPQAQLEAQEEQLAAAQAIGTQGTQFDEDARSQSFAQQDEQPAATPAHAEVNAPSPISTTQPIPLVISKAAQISAQIPERAWLEMFSDSKRAAASDQLPFMPQFIKKPGRSVTPEKPDRMVPPERSPRLAAREKLVEPAAPGKPVEAVAPAKPAEPAAFIKPAQEAAPAREVGMVASEKLAAVVAPEKSAQMVAPEKPKTTVKPGSNLVNYDTCYRKAEIMAAKELWAISAALYEESSLLTEVTDDALRALFAATSSYVKAKKNGDAKRLLEQIGMRSDLKAPHKMKLQAILKMIK
jgi:hypothetical protein